MIADSQWWGIRKPSRHSVVLLIAGISYVALGISFRLYNLAAVPKRSLVNLTLALRWMPLKAWGLVFIFAGLLVILSSCWPRKKLLWGYVVLTGLSAVWSGFYFASVLVYRSTKNNMAGGITWALLSFLGLAISGLLNPTEGASDASG